MEEGDKKKEVIEEEFEKYKPVDPAITNMLSPLIHKKDEERRCFSTSTIALFKFQKDFVSSVQRALGFRHKGEFMRFALLSFCMEQKQILDAKYKIDEEFKKYYSNFRKKYLSDKFKLKEKIAEVRQRKIDIMVEEQGMSPQDIGGDPFTADDLME